jgi:hypothetical protein
MERVTIPLIIKTVAQFNFVYGKYDPMNMTNQPFHLKSNKSFWSLPFGVQYKGKENLLKK